jgi:hypothetical protein
MTNLKLEHALKTKLGLLLLAICMTLGCTLKLHFYPVHGPLSSLTPIPVLPAKISGLSSGKISVVLNTGEICNGQWTLVRETAATGATGSAMSSVWDNVYGQGFYVAHVLGSRLYARSVASGNRGTTLHVELYKSTGGDLKGVAQDNNGNVYKIVPN